MVIVFELPHCPQCRATTRQLDKLGIPYITESASSHMEELKEMGYSSAPVVKSPNGEHWSGFRPDKIKSLLEQPSLVV